MVVAQAAVVITTSDAPGPTESGCTTAFATAAATAGLALALSAALPRGGAKAGP
ncbi:hypothetical protein [Streptomyces sp. NPDC002845]